MAIREFLQCTEEAAFGVFNPAPVLNTNQFVVRLDDANAFTMRPAPIPVRIMAAGGWATPAYTVSDKIQLQGALRLKLCYSQAPFFLNWALQPINGGQTTPWTTTEPPGDLPSVTIDHAIWNDDNSTYRRRRYLGCKVGSGRMEISAESQICTLTLQIVGGTPQGNFYDGSTDPSSGVFPVPAFTDYPIDYLLFTHSSGNFTLGSALTKYESLNVDFNNKLDPRFFASNFVQEIRILGRELTLEAMLKLDSAPDFRSQFEKIQPLTTSVEFNNQINTVTMNYQTNTIISKLDDDLALDKIYFRNAGVSSQLDANSGIDFTLAFT